MRTTQLTLGALAAVATTALTGLGVASPAAALTATAEQATTTTHEVGNAREVADGFIHEKQVHGSLKVGGKRVVIDGYASRHGKRLPIHEQYDDAGQHITADGFHRKLATDLTLTWRHRTTRLSCDTAFFYNLTVTKEDITS